MEFIYSLLLLLVTNVGCNALITDRNEGIRFLDYYERFASDYFHKSVSASWNYYTNLTTHNLNLMTAANLEFSAFEKEAAKNASRFAWKSFQNDTVKRLFQKMTNIGFAAVNDTAKLKLIYDLEANLTNIYSKGKVCNIPEIEGCLELEPGLVQLLEKSRNEKQLRAAWTGFRDATGKKMRDMYERFVNAMNEAIKFSGFNDTGEYWRAKYESPTFESDVRDLYNEQSELYQHLHYYVRQKLKNTYNADVFPETGHLPAHLLGNMWAQYWVNIYDLVIPYPNVGKVDVTTKMRNKGYNVTYMYQLAEDFYTSIGLLPMPEKFWTGSMLEKPTDRDVVCHASAWDFGNGEDFRFGMLREQIDFQWSKAIIHDDFSDSQNRIKQCTSVTEGELYTVYHEMGHVSYDMQYKNLPFLFRDGANPGFHEGMADISTLSLQTPEHLYGLGLIDSIPSNNDTDADINFLLRVALDKVAFIPFGYLIDQWRWSVMRGEITPKTYNRKWWELRCEIQGISPPVGDDRNEEYFDPGAKYHIPGNTPYIRYFVSNILQFMWHKGLCDEAGHTGPLHRCDIYNSVAAGDKLKEMLRMGASKHWSEALYVVTGKRRMSAEPLIEYFKPLLKWLKKQNGNGDIGWNTMCPHHIKSRSSSVVNRLSDTLTFVLAILMLNLK